MKPEVKRYTPDELLGFIHDLASNGEGADRRWALSKLSGGENSGITLEKPKTDQEVNERASRILRGIGFERAKDAFRAAFPAGTPTQWGLARKKGVTYVPVTIKELLDLFPEVELDTNGDPLGYPKSGSTILSKKRWIADKATELNAARKAAEQIQQEHATDGVTLDSKAD